MLTGGTEFNAHYKKIMYCPKKKKKAQNTTTPLFPSTASRSKFAPKLPAFSDRRGRAQQHPAQACAGSSRVAASFAGELGGLLPGLGRTTALPCSCCPAVLGAFQPPRARMALGSPSSTRTECCLQRMRTKTADTTQNNEERSHRYSQRKEIN